VVATVALKAVVLQSKQAVSALGVTQRKDALGVTAHGRTPSVSKVPLSRL
jgi:hypothetical protein